MPTAAFRKFMETHEYFFAKSTDSKRKFQRKIQVPEASYRSFLKPSLSKIYIDLNIQLKRKASSRKYYMWIETKIPTSRSGKVAELENNEAKFKKKHTQILAGQ